MEACDGGGMEFQQENAAAAAAAPNFEHANPISQEASTVAMNPMVMMPKPPNTHRDPFFSPNWDSFSSMTQSYQTFVSHQDFENFSFPPVPLWENQGMAPNMAQYLPTHSGFVETVPRAPCFMNRSLPDCLPQGPNHIPPGPNYASNVEGGGGASEGTQNKEGEAMSSPSSEMRRKRTPESSSTYDRIKQSNEGMLKRDASGDNSNVQKDHYEKKQRTEQPEGTNSRGKQTKDDSNSGQPAKENYIHMRARRGQATNSHSLAERVRREKISERMRMLQELVPGCNKITGKAVMLDEIINYVQSLQQQVEFLSMKLSTLLPDMSFDLEQILSKEILQAHNREPMVGGLGPMTGLTALPSTSQYASLPQAPLDNELQTLFQMGFDSTSAMDILKHSSNLLSTVQF